MRGEKVEGCLLAGANRKKVLAGHREMYEFWFHAHVDGKCVTVTKKPGRDWEIWDGGDAEFGWNKGDYDKRWDPVELLVKVKELWDHRVWTKGGRKNVAF